MCRVLLAGLVETSQAVTATSARLGKVAALAEALRRLDPGEVEAGVAFLSGELRQRQIGVGYAALRDAPAPAEEPTLTVAETDASFGRIGALAGAGSQRARREALAALFGRATSRRAALPGGALERRAAPGRAGGRDGRRGRAGSPRCRAPRCAGR